GARRGRAARPHRPPPARAEAGRQGGARADRGGAPQSAPDRDSAQDGADERTGRAAAVAARRTGRATLSPPARVRGLRQRLTGSRRRQGDAGGRTGGGAMVESVDSSNMRTMTDASVVAHYARPWGLSPAEQACFARIADEA